MPLVRSAPRRATRTGRGFATPCGGMAEPRPQRVVMHGRRDGQHVLFSSLPGEWVCGATARGSVHRHPETRGSPRFTR